MITEFIPHVLIGQFPDLDWRTVFTRRRRLPSEKAIENAKQRAEKRKNN